MTARTDVTKTRTRRGVVMTPSIKQVEIKTIDNCRATGEGTGSMFGSAYTSTYTKLHVRMTCG